MQGIWIDGRRPKSKHEIVQTIAEDPARVRVEGTSIRRDDYDGPVSSAPVGRIDFVGPDPYTSRKFYGSITVKGGGLYKVT